MKTKNLLTTLVVLVCFAASAHAAKEEMILFKEPLWAPFPDTSLYGCDGLFYVYGGKDVPDLRDFQYYFCDGKYSFTLDGPPGTTATVFGKFSFARDEGYLIIRKKDDRQVWVIDPEAFPHRQWVGLKAQAQSGAYEAFYHPGPLFRQSISSVKWGKWWTGDEPPMGPDTPSPRK